MPDKKKKNQQETGATPENEIKAELEKEKKGDETQPDDETNEEETLAKLKEASEKDREALAEITAKAEEYKDKWYRTAAEFDNFKKRNAETRRTAYEEGKTDTIKKILFIGDNVERALSYDLDEKTKQGLNLLLRQYNEIISGMGLEEINPVGEAFDPNLHEAIFTKPCEEGQKSDTVESVFLKGYKMGNKIIRYAQVVVIK